jgi:hypothetical protein
LETRGIVYSKSTTIYNITFMDIDLNPTCFIKLAIPNLGVLRLPIGLLYMVSKWSLCSPRSLLKVFGEPCGVGALDSMTSYFPTNILEKDHLSILFISLTFFHKFLWTLEMGCFSPKSSISSHVKHLFKWGIPLKCSFILVVRVATIVAIGSIFAVIIITYVISGCSITWHHLVC